MQNVKDIRKAFLCFMIMILSVGFLFIPLKTDSAHALEDYRKWRQGDPRWGSKYLGDSDDTVKESGCAITALTMLCVHSGEASADEINPGIVVDYYNAVNGFNKFGGIASWKTISDLVPGLKFCGSVNMSFETEAEIADQLESYMQEGYYVICHVKGHFVLIDSVIDDKVYMIDPAYDGIDMFEKYPELNYIDSVRLFKATKPPVNTAPASTLPAQTTTTKKITTTTTKSQVTTTKPAQTTNKPVATTTGATVTTAPTTTTKPQSYKIGFYKTTANLNNRKGPSTSYASYGIIPNGTQIPVYEVSNGWGKTYYNGNEAWVSLEYATFNSEFKFIYGGYTALSDVKMLTKQTLSSDTILTIPKNASFEVAASNGIWGFAHYNGKTGWINLLNNVSVNKNTNFEKGLYKALFPINLRENSLLSGKLLTVIPQNAEFTVEAEGYDCVKVTYNGITGWAYIYSAESIPESALIPTGEYFITSDKNADLYSKADLKSNVMMNAPSGFVINILEVENGFGKLKMGADTVWISMESVTYAGNPELLQKGDINGDGSIDNLDLAVLNQYLDSIQLVPDGISMLRQCELDSADINNSGIVDKNDVLDYLIKICIN